MHESEISTSASTIRSLHIPIPSSAFSHAEASGTSEPGSPHSSLDSPSSDSVSSFPSVSSSFFHSSAPDSPHHSQPHSEHTRDDTQGLLIPSLALPDALRQPTPYGKTLGELRLLVVGGKDFLSKLLLDENDEIVDAGEWQTAELGRVRRASTDWIDRRDMHGLEHFEPSRNVEIHELGGDPNDSASEVVAHVKYLVQTPFQAITEVLDPSCDPSGPAANLLSSPFTPLYSALVLLMPSSPTNFERTIVEELSSYIPIIALPRIPDDINDATLSAFKPPSPISLRYGLFRNPEVISSIRGEAADRFFRWREVSHLTEGIRARRQRTESVRHLHWTEKDWADYLSYDVAKRLKEDTPNSAESQEGRACYEAGFDPLHFTSMVMFALSLLGPAKRSIFAFFRDWNVRISILGGFCLGLGIGLRLK
ncbi:hypothetical protein CYLTODRAFT_353638 [Cylindrobasidium torrendii FP15055 ss-10]|uniref:Uncharacterized protein n=1 Tax=Cylindrobasidium torrendii FP15055 ss-10 TaxID=1314674 RepID=A0A0D7BAJ8_9AGAR|nr:hypothetical protein CYLTODRAFT_353638 [Cylindrobasidium torrendii FP15055 ss-10]